MFAEAYQLTGNLLTVRDIIRSVYKRVETPWVIEREDELMGVALTQTVQYPQRVTIRINTLAGHSLEEWVDEALKAFEDWAIALGITYFEYYGRLGFNKFLKPHGYKLIQGLYVKDEQEKGNPED
jgi:hypothetical protein